jgi:hypothetical protein
MLGGGAEDEGSLEPAIPARSDLWLIHMRRHRQGRGRRTRICTRRRRQVPDRRICVKTGLHRHGGGGAGERKRQRSSRNGADGWRR